MATFRPEDWTPGFDEFNRPCWYNKSTRTLVYNQFPPEAPAAAGLSTMSGANPNIPPAAPFTPATGVTAEMRWKQALAKAWKEYETDETNESERKRYWHNSMSGETTWEKPDEYPAADKPPPPPAKPAAPIPPRKKEKESDQWEKLRNNAGKKYWYNTKTGESQFETPDCLRKYR